MSKSLILLRHAKSSWSDPGCSDFDRPLNRRGQRATAVIRLFLEQERVRPDQVLCSAAKRTVETWEGIEEGLPTDVPVLFTREIYEAPPETLLDALRAVGEPHRTVMMIGHNPGMERLVELLCSSGAEEAMIRVGEKFPTGALAFVDLDIGNWSEIAAGTGTLTRFVAPKDLV